jgi:SAM-dependent methyltransferase
MDITQHTDDEQTALWNGTTGQAWVASQTVIDQVFKPFEDLLVKEVSAAISSGDVLDVGCGTGSTTVAVARLLGAKGHAIGIDISEPMVAAARDRAKRENVSANFVRADAQSYSFEPASFDMIVSRFGVMFFDDFVRAFGNLRLAARDNCQLRLITWRAPAENPFMTTAERAAAPSLPNLLPRVPDAPGQFALADQHRIYRILEESGWDAIDIRPINVACTLPEQELVPYFTRFGPLGRVFHEVDEPTRTQVIQIVRTAFDPYVHGAEVRFIAACWLVGARALPGPGVPKD